MTKDRHLRDRAVLLVAGAVLATSCGSGGSSASPKAQWLAQHGGAVTAVRMELDAARAALNQGDRQAALGACGLLGDDVSEARKGLPVPDPVVDGALRQGLDAASTGASDCLQGARIASVASLNEKAMAELAAAKPLMDQAQQAIAAWR